MLHPAQIPTSAPAPKKLAGQLNWPSVAKILVPQVILTVFLTIVGLCGVVCLTIYGNPKGLIATPAVFLGLGVALLSLALVGWYVRVARYWLGVARQFSWDGECLAFRTLFSQRWREYRVEEIASLSACRANAREESSSLRLVRFRDGRSVRFPVGPLENTEPLYVELKTACERFAEEQLASERLASERLASEGALERAVHVTSDHPCLLSIQPHLATGESVLWFGRPVWTKLWSEMSAEVVFGLIPGAFAIGLAGVGWHVTVRQGNLSGFVPAVAGMLFGGLSAYLVAAPWRFRRMVRDAIYVVTDRRVLLVHGLVWGQRAPVQRDVETWREIPRDQVSLFELADNQRDLLLGGEWRRGYKGARHWVHFGMLAVDDPHRAVQALRRFSAQVPGDASVQTAFDC